MFFCFILSVFLIVKHSSTKHHTFVDDTQELTVLWSTKNNQNQTVIVSLYKVCSFSVVLCNLLYMWHQVQSVECQLEKLIPLFGQPWVC